VSELQNYELPVVQWILRSFHTSTVCLFSILCAAGPVWGAENTSYTYDALGRLIAVRQQAGPQAGVNTTFDYDAAGNRSFVKVTGATGPVTSGPPKQIVVILPFIGYQIITKQ
jgi:hypothetical protein